MIIYIVLGAFALGSSIVLATELTKVRTGKKLFY
jgi:hypothetical protein